MCSEHLLQDQLFSPINFQMTKLRLKAGNDSNHDKEIIKAEDESKNEGTASVNTEDMGEEVAKESSEKEVEVGKDENFSCEPCEKGFATFSLKATHVKNVHSNTEPHPCELCGKSFGTVGIRKTHIKNVHSKLKPFSCEKCGKCFGTAGIRKNHIENVHTEHKHKYIFMSAV